MTSYFQAHLGMLARARNRLYLWWAAMSYSQIVLRVWTRVCVWVERQPEQQQARVPERLPSAARSVCRKCSRKPKEVEGRVQVGANALRLKGK